MSPMSILWSRDNWPPMILCNAVWSLVCCLLEVCCAIPPFCNCKMHYSTTSSKNFLIIDYWNATQSVYCMCRCLHISILCTSSGQVGNGLQWWGGLCVSPDSLSFPTCVSLDWSVRDLLFARMRWLPADLHSSPTVSVVLAQAQRNMCVLSFLSFCVSLHLTVEARLQSKILRFKYSQGSLPNGVCRQELAKARTRHRVSTWVVESCGRSDERSLSK